MNCQWQGCDQEGTHYPKICVPAAFLPLHKCPPLTLIVGLTACEKHAKLFDAHEFLGKPTPDGKSTLKQIFKLLSRGRPKPNFMRTFVETILITSKEAQQFDENRQRANGSHGSDQSVSSAH